MLLLLCIASKICRCLAPFVVIAFTLAPYLIVTMLCRSSMVFMGFEVRLTIICVVYPCVIMRCSLFVRFVVAADIGSPPHAPYSATPWNWWEFIPFSCLFFWRGGLGGAGSQGTDSPPPQEQIEFPPLVTAVNTPNDGRLPGSCMGVISALSFFPSGVGRRARAQGFSPTLPCATQRGPSTYEHKF